MSSSDVAAIAAQYLEQNSEAIVDRWIDWVQQRVATATVGALPAHALRNHVPPVLLSLARYVRNPVEIVRQELLSHLRLHGQVRRDQGYSLKEVLAEFDGLADIVTQNVTTAIEPHLDASPADVLTVANRLAAGLRSVSYIAMGTYEDYDTERHQAVSSSLEEFARAISHELRNPLNTLALGLQVIRPQVADRDDLVDQLEVMATAVSRSVQLLDTVNLLAVAEEARAGDRLASLDDAIYGVLNEFAHQTAKAEISVQVDEPLPKVSLEAVLLYIVMANVLGNAIKYADSAKPERHVRVAARLIEEEHDSGFCEIRVTDNGVGIPEEHLSRVCQKGFRAHPDLAQGTGLGLYIVQRAVLERGGRFSIDSVEGEWTEVTIRTRCLPTDAGALTAERFSVEHLMGESVWSELKGQLEDQRSREKN